MDTWLSSELGKVKGVEEEEWHLTSVTLLPVQVGSLTATSPMAIIGYETTFTLSYLWGTAWPINGAQHGLSMEQPSLF